MYAEHTRTYCMRMSECTFKGHFCTEIKPFKMKKEFLSLQLSFKRPDPQ